MRSSAACAGALQNHTAGSGQARDLRGEGLVRRSGHGPGRARAEICIPATPDESFALRGDDTIASIRQAYREACQASRQAASNLGLDDVVNGNRRGPLPLRSIYLHMLRELAQHCGHADILREQLLSREM